MAIVRCPVCRERMSSKAASCPHCGGDPDAPGKRGNRGVLWSRTTHILLASLMFLAGTWAYGQSWVRGIEPNAWAYTFIGVGIVWYAAARLGTWWD